MSSASVDGFVVEDQYGNVVDLSKHKRKGGAMVLLMWLIAIFLVALVIFIVFRPPAVLGTNGQVDYGKAALAALIVALAGVIIVAIIRACRK